MDIHHAEVQATNDASVLSKISAVQKGYMQDDYQRYFAAKLVTRAPLINLGYYTRFAVIDRLIKSYTSIFQGDHSHQFQIVSCGAGFDSLYWRLTDSRALKNGKLIEIDFKNVIERKLELMEKSDNLCEFLKPKSEWIFDENCVQVSANYLLVSCDLSNIEKLWKIFKVLEINFDLPTMFLSECAVTYMNLADSNNLFKWIGSNFQNSALIVYEQILPNDGYGKIMTRHFERIKSPLLSIDTFPTRQSHVERYLRLGFETCQAIDEWNLLKLLIPNEDLTQSFEREQFDEFEEIHGKCNHYVVAMVGKGTLRNWYEPFGSNYMNFDLPPAPCLPYRFFDLPFQIYGHSSGSIGGDIYIFGGIALDGKSRKVFRLRNNEEDIVANELQISHSTVDFNMIHGCVSVFSLNGNNYILVYGGRTSPGRVWMDGGLVLVDSNGMKISKVECATIPRPRYRTQMTVFSENSNSVEIYMFGGRTSTLKDKLNDFWLLTVTMRNNVPYFNWGEVIHTNGPSSRMSHGLVAGNRLLYLTGGLDACTYEALSDLWCWDPNTKIWTKLDLTDNLTPRYGHTCHYFENKVILIGGATTFYGYLPSVSVIFLDSLKVQEYSFQFSDPSPYILFNHTSELNQSKKEIVILGGGGNCFSFGSHLNNRVVYFSLLDVNI